MNLTFNSLGSSDDMAGAALYLSSRAGAWVTGTVLVVDGGFVNQPVQFHLESHL